MRWSQRRKARTLALLRQLASWRFDEKATMRDQLVRYEEAPRTYEASEWQAFSGGCGAGGVGDWTKGAAAQPGAAQTVQRHKDKEGQRAGMDSPVREPHHALGLHCAQHGRRRQPAGCAAAHGRGRDQGQAGQGRQGQERQGPQMQAGQVAMAVESNGPSLAGEPVAGTELVGSSLAGAREREKEVDPGRTRRPAIFAGSSAWECPAKGKNKGRVNQAETNAVPNSSASTLTNASTTLPSARSAGAPSTRSRPFAVRLPPALPGYDCLG